MRMIAKLITVVGLAAGVAGGAQAANIVTNGGFETGDFTGWTGTGNTAFNGVLCPGPSSIVAEGNCAGFFGPIGSTGGITQTLNLLVGRSYTISFAFQPDGGNPSSFSASLGTGAGSTLVSLTNPAASGYQTFTFSRLATSASEDLAFSFRDDPGFLFLDAVSVSVPEPASLALLGIGLAGIGFARRRKS